MKKKIQDNDVLLMQAFHKMNIALTPEEREAVNALRREMWYAGDLLRDMSRLPSAKIYCGLGQKLMDNICKIPVLEV